MIVLAAGIISTAAIAQKTHKPVPPAPPAPPEMKDLPPAPPAPPGVAAMEAPPPPPPAPPKPPKPPVIKSKTGYVITVMQQKDDDIVLLRKNGITQKIRMSVWNAKPEYFEKKYGMLPPPPPALPKPPVKE